MFGKKRTNEKWKDFEQRVSAKRNKNEKKDHTVPADIMVQRMSPSASGRLKKFEPVDTRDFVPFSDFTELSIDNIKQACERFYKAPERSCDILASDRGPSCTKMEQLKGKKVYYIRFIDTIDKKVTTEETTQETDFPTSTPLIPVRDPTCTNQVKSKFAKSISIGELLKAGKLVRKVAPSMLELEDFNIDSGIWEKKGCLELVIEETKFAKRSIPGSF